MTRVSDGFETRVVLQMSSSVVLNHGFCFSKGSWVRELHLKIACVSRTIGEGLIMVYPAAR
jgi:hypothetical protein